MKMKCFSFKKENKVSSGTWQCLGGKRIKYYWMNECPPEIKQFLIYYMEIHELFLGDSLVCSQLFNNQKLRVSYLLNNIKT